MLHREQPCFALCAQLALAIREVANPPLVPAKWRRHITLRAWRRRNGSLCRSNSLLARAYWKEQCVEFYFAVDSDELELKSNSLVGLANW
ncbi:hypothetical protein PIB30_098347, partial [Stylosanthes scabra]|nr:hypothetical protein [Stylosanthes scabra]